MATDPTPPSGESAPPSLEERDREAVRRMAACIMSEGRDHRWTTPGNVLLLAAEVARLTAENERLERLWGQYDKSVRDALAARDAPRRVDGLGEITFDGLVEQLRRHIEAQERAEANAIAEYDRALAAEARAARAEEALGEVWWLVQNADPHAWDNGNTGPGGYPDEGGVLASQIMERVAPVADPLVNCRALTEGADR